MSYAREAFVADPLAVRDALLRLERGAVLDGLDRDQRDIVLLVLAEVLNNVAEHAYGGAAGPVAVSLRCRKGDVFARVVDRGVVAPLLGRGEGLDPLAMPEGGFGTGLIRTLAQGIGQSRRMGCNVLRFHVVADNPTESGPLFPVFGG